jgi:hypothetical protein
MDLSTPLKTDVLRPLVTLVVPGIIAVGPFALVLGDYVPPVAQFWNDHPNAFAVLLAIAVLAAGFVIEDIGASIENYCWDRLMSRGDSTHLANWNEYLKLRMDKDLVGQQYLETRVTVLKFELAMAPALMIFWLGLLWLQADHAMWSTSGFLMVTLLLFAGSGYFFWESWQTANLLSRTRALILDAVKTGPRGVVSGHRASETEERASA